MAVVTISGSPCAPSRCTAVLAHVATLLEKNGVTTQSLVVRDLPAEDLVHGRWDNAAIKAAGDMIEHAEGVAIAAPIYKGAVSGVLKAFFDLLKQNALRGKVVLPIAVGGSLAHLLAVDYSLKPVLSALGATHVLGCIYAIDRQVEIGDGQAELDDDIPLRLQAGVDRFVHAAGLVSDGIKLPRKLHLRAAPAVSPLA